MKRVVLFLLPLYGHVYPNKSLFEALKNSQMDILCFCGESFKDYLDEYKFKVVKYCDEIEASFRNETKFFMNGKSNREQYYSTFIDEEKILLSGEVEVNRARLIILNHLDEIIEFNPDCILYDSVATYGMLIGEKLNISYFSLEAGIFMPKVEESEVYKNYFNEVIRNELGREIEFDRIIKALNKARRKVIKNFTIMSDKKRGYNFKTTKTFGYITKSIQIENELIDDSSVYCGFSIETPELINKKNKIFFTRGTIFDSYNVEIFIEMLEVLKDVDLEVVATTGNMIKSHEIVDESLLNCDNIKIYTSVDQIKELANSKIMVTHGGITGVREAIFCETPVIIFPNNFLCYQVGLAIEKSGAGIMLKEHPFSKTELDIAIKEITKNEANYIKNIKRLKSELVNCFKNSNILCDIKNIK